MRVYGVLIMILIFSSIIPTAFGQSTDLLDPDICSLIEIKGAKSWIPFSLKLFYPDTEDIEFKIDSDEIAPPPYERGGDLGSFTFFSKETTTWDIFFTVNYEEEAERSMQIEYWSQGNPTQVETRKIPGLSFCQHFQVTTTAPPVIPSVSDYLTEAGEIALNEMTDIVPTLNANTDTIGRNSAFQFGAIVIFGILIYFVLQQNKQIRKEKISTQTQIIRAAADAANNSKAAKDAALYLTDEIIPTINQKMDAAINQMQVQSNSLFVDIKKSLNIDKEKPVEEKPQVKPMVKPIVESKVEPKKDLKKSIVNNIKSTVEQVITIPMDKFTEYKQKSKSQNIEDEKEKKVDFDRNQNVSRINLKKLYIRNPNNINSNLYKFYWNKSNEEPQNNEFLKRRDILDNVLRIQADLHEKMRQEEPVDNGDKNES